MEIPVTPSWISNEWRFIISIVAPVVAIALAWGSFQTNQAVMSERLKMIEAAHTQTFAPELARQTESIAQIKVDIATIKTALTLNKIITLNQRDLSLSDR